MRMLMTLQQHACTFQHAVHAQLVQRRTRLSARRIHRVPLLVQHFAQLRAVAAISLAVALCPTGARPSRQAAAHSHTARAVYTLTSARKTRELCMRICMRLPACALHWQASAAVGEARYAREGRSASFKGTCRPIPRLAPKTTATPVFGVTAIFSKEHAPAQEALHGVSSATALCFPEFPALPDRHDLPSGVALHCTSARVACARRALRLHSGGPMAHEHAHARARAAHSQLSSTMCGCWHCPWARSHPYAASTAG